MRKNRVVRERKAKRRLKAPAVRGKGVRVIRQKRRSLSSTTRTFFRKITAVVWSGIEAIWMISPTKPRASENR